MTAETCLGTKTTLLAPAPDGGSFTAPTTDSRIPYLLSAGWTVSRVWTVWTDADGRLFSVDIATGARSYR